jgi:short-subunit dehydrogenase
MHSAYAQLQGDPEMGDLFVGIGTGPGMGMTTASRFARGGFDLVLASKNTSKLEPLADELRRSTGRNVETVSLEATDPTAVQALADRVGDRVGVLHYNVAIMEKTGIETSVDDFRRNLEVDITGAFAAIRSFVPGMETRHKGTILLTGGGYALNPNADYLALSIGKAGIRCMAQALFKPLAAKGVHIATFTVTRTVPAGSADATGVAEGFWRLHSEPEGNWTWEASLR